MKVSGTKKRQLRVKRALRVRKRLISTSDRPRLVVKKTNKHLSAQIIDDTKHATLASFSTLSKENKGTPFAKKGKESAKKIGEEIAARALSQNIKAVVFDRGACKYHGLLAIVADSAREKGLEL